MLQRWFVLLLLLTVTTVTSQAQRGYDFTNYEQTLESIATIGIDIARFDAATAGYFEAIGEHGDPLYIAPLIDVLYFAFGEPSIEVELYGALEQLTGQPPLRGWRGYLEWASENDIALPPGYDAFKGRFFGSLIDSRFPAFFENVQETANVNLVEAVWGGVQVDGIPSLVNARQISPEEALIEGATLTQFCSEDDCSYPQTDEFVFGVYVDGDARAYPLRLMNWHEMFNDVIGHTPLYDAPDGNPICNFRAPTVFDALARSGDAFVQINGLSAGCETEGWLAVDALEWLDSDWNTVREQLPDVENGEIALTPQNSLQGRVSGRPVMLAYCTLCGAGILYDVTIPDLSYTDTAGTQVDLGETVLEFGSTGMLMRSNKLMYDRTTNTVWNAFTGIPAFGVLASTDIELPLLPAVVTTWSDWLEDHPDTSVLSLETGFRRNYTNGGAYTNYFNTSDLMFPSFQQDTENVENKEMIFGLNFDDTPRAYPLFELFEQPVINDTLDDVNLVIISEASPTRNFFEPGGAAVRAYQRNDLIFSQTEIDNEVLDSDGVIWQITEDALVSADGRILERIAGHLAFWFGWYGFYPETDLYMTTN
ncbi:MAG: DUF3179 domain-containing (seleno)protein [Phototrophicaceae bacterium]